MSTNKNSVNISDITALYGKQLGALNSDTLNVVRTSLDALKISDRDMPKVGRIEELSIPGPECDIRLKLFYPKEIKEIYPGLVYFHGGGWILGNNEAFDYVCSTLTNLSNCITISVDYRLAPEHKFPAAFNDCYFATQYIYEHAKEFQIDADNIIIAGDSAGGNLAAAVSNMAKDKGTPKIRGQILVYPSTAAGIENEFPSIKENGKGNLLTEDGLNLALGLYATDASDMKDPRFSPILYSDFEGLPATFIITAEKCPLRDEGEAYAKKLEEAGVETKYICYKGMIHGFLNAYMDGFLDEGKEALKEMGNWLVKHYK